ncbi:hypothetical protein PUNSTDRAFT_58013 [Punctularia strigosozonata HHB-11173 SS5]|uniref:uncharacterized protein n=1 Tax=Punctularia strigosozonata (strain HHB-11173) TaxID=741275 RepID=UPI0004416E2C|nr:uncharacterized protein PUNSTDRAFT_58013 [Punctularia strigosozonata HHB-11173 SS5]EIN13340.1 hypothetical protein PUNSTDRAFT_58013 [Punctularia strigosozonata HHB-11173 SS5]
MGPAWTQPPLKPLLSDLLDRSSRSRSKSKSRPKSKKTTNKKKQKPGSSPQSPLAAASSSSSHPPPESHVDLPSGLLLANPSAPQHPLHALIASAERAWSATLARQSKSLDEAAAEYRRRYGGRAPPRGFDRWWDYVEAHDVRLPDEYDQIEDDLATFRALSPRQLQEIVGAWEGHKETFTIGKLGSWRGAGINIVNATLNGGPGDPNWEMHVRGARALIALLKDVEQWIPPFRAVFSPHDNPNLLASWRLREEAKKAVAEGRYLDIHDLPPHENIGWLSACAPTSPARALATPFPPSSESYETSFPDLSAPNRTRTFVRSHLAAMDPCTHPSLFTSHGQFLSHHAGPGLESPPLVPQFSYSTSAAHADLRPAGVGGWVEDVEGDLGWEEKERRDEEEAGRGGERRAGKLLWRGSNTGIWCGGDHRWWEAQRERLVMMAEEGEGVVSLMVANSSSSEGEGQGQGWRGEGQGWHVVEVERRALRDALLDVHFAGGPMQCAEEVCPVLEDMFDWRENMDTREAGRYKYVMDVDGNGWSSRFKRLITSHAVVLKATVYPEWFSRRIQPWVHFVPVKNDYSDVMDIMAFFTGYGGGEDNDHLARKIAEAGREWSRTMWRKEDLTAYMFRMLLEYARLMSLDRDQMDFQDIEDQW